MSVKYAFLELYIKTKFCIEVLASGFALQGTGRKNIELGAAETMLLFRGLKTEDA